MDEFEPTQPALQRVWKRLSRACRRKRWEQANKRERVLQEVAARTPPETEKAALLRVAPQMNQPSFSRWKQRYAAYGLEGLVDGRIPPKSPLSEKAAEEICTLRRADPQIAVHKLVSYVAGQHQEKTNDSTVKRVLKAAGLCRRPGPVAGSKRAEQPLMLGGMKLLEAALVETEYLTVLAKGVQGCLDRAPTNPEAGEPDRTDRDEYGRFLPGYNERLRKGDRQQIGPGFQSVDIKREGLVVERLHASGASTDVIERKLLALLVSPLLGTGRWEGLRCARGELLEELCGYPYMHSTLDLFIREMKYLGVSSTMWEIHACEAELLTRTWGDPQRAAVAYVDGSSKEVHTQLFSQATKVSQRNQVLPALDVVALHSGYGVPLYQVTYSGRAALVEEVPKVLEALKPALSDSLVGRIVVIDAEGNSVPFLMGLEQGSPKRGWVTRLRPSLLKGKRIFNRSNYRAYRNGDRVRTGLVDLNIPDSKARYRIRVIEVERRRKGTVTYLGASTLLEERTWKAEQVADLYFDRWPMQEANFRAVNQAVGSKQVHGYGKQWVTNVTVVNELEDLSVQVQRQQEAIDKGQASVVHKEQALREATTTLRRSKRRLQTVTRQVDGQLARDVPVVAALRKGVQEQRGLAKALRQQSAQVERRQQDLDRDKDKQQKCQQRQMERGARFDELQDRKQIYRHDVELDSLFGLLQVGLVFLVTYLLKEYFGDACMAPSTFLERLATLPARRNMTPQYEIITFEYNRRDPEVMALLLANTEAINSRRLQLRSGRILRIHVDPAPKPTRPPPPQRRTNSDDRFRRPQPKV